MSNFMNLNKKNILIHVGLPKSGSTYLQSQLFKNAENVRYFGQSPNEYLSNLLNKIAWKNPFNLDFKVEEDRAQVEMQNIEETNIIFSREAFSGNIYSSMISSYQNARALKEIFPYAKILLVIRRQDAFVQSCYKQAIQQGHSISWRKYLQFYGGDFRTEAIPCLEASACLDVKELDWMKLVERYIDIFGETNLLVLPVEMLAENEKEFISKVTDFSGINFKGRTRLQRKNAKNIGYYSGTIWIARVLNLFLIRRWNPIGILLEKPLTNFKIIKRLQSIHSLNRLLQVRGVLQVVINPFLSWTGEPIPRNVMSKIVDFHQNNNEQLSELIKIDLSVYGYHRKK